MLRKPPTFETGVYYTEANDALAVAATNICSGGDVDQELKQHKIRFHLIWEIKNKDEGAIARDFFAMALFLMIKGDVEMNLRMKQKLMVGFF